MTSIIYVGSSIDPREHTSFEDATNETSFKVTNDGEIKGKIVEHVKYDGNTIVISFFETAYIAVISIGENRLHLTIVDARVDQYVRNNHCRTGKFILKFESEDYAWEPALFFNRFIGKKITLIPGREFVFLHTEDGNELMFDFITDKENINEPLLYMSEC